ncbi:hypothetical protein BRY73_00425 [Ochrobactrum sp. P6BS-III]|nr:hypothetical protein BRY73_00425 [Ochrobactrum sp. P6BS-III]
MRKLYFGGASFYWALQKSGQKKSRTKKSGLVMKVPLGQTSRGEHLPRAMGGGTAVSNPDMDQLAPLFNPLVAFF